MGILKFKGFFCHSDSFFFLVVIPAHLLSKVSSKNWLWFVYWAFSYNFLSLCIIYYHHSLSYLLPFLSIIVKQASYAWSRGQFWIRSSFLQRIPFTKLIIIWFVFCLSQILLLCVFFLRIFEAQQKSRSWSYRELEEWYCSISKLITFPLFCSRFIVYLNFSAVSVNDCLHCRTWRNQAK